MLNPSTPKSVRLAIYALYDACSIARNVLAAPTRRDSYGRLLNLPRFGALAPGLIYRSAEPRTAAHEQHISRLGIRTLVCVRGGGPSPSTVELAERAGIRLCVFDLGHGHQYDLQALRAAVDAALDPDNQPVLIHCDGGRHRAGMTTALVRHRQGWTPREILDEYWAFAQPSPCPDNIDVIVRCLQGNEPGRPRRGVAEGSPSFVRARSACACPCTNTPGLEGNCRQWECVSGHGLHVMRST